MWINTSLFPSRHRSCPDCLRRTVTVNDQEQTEFYHPAVFSCLTGMEFPIPVDVELYRWDAETRKNEDEAKVAVRLLERVFRKLPRLVDGIVGDQSYLEAPLMNFCFSHGKEVIASLKDEKRDLYKDAAGLFRIVQPMTWREGKKGVNAWDAGDFTSYKGVQKPLRVLHTQEVTTRSRHVAGELRKLKELRDWWWATSYRQDQLPTRSLCEGGHHRWDIDASFFDELVTYWCSLAEQQPTDSRDASTRGLPASGVPGTSGTAALISDCLTGRRAGVYLCYSQARAWGACQNLKGGC